MHPPTNRDPKEDSCSYYDKKTGNHMTMTGGGGSLVTGTINLGPELAMRLQ